MDRYRFAGCAAPAQLCSYWVRSRLVRTSRGLERPPFFDRHHFVHVSAAGATRHPLVIFLRGWPYSFATFLGLVALLTEPDRYSGEAGLD